MIVTVTLNPAVDKTLVVDALIPGGLHRVQEAVLDAGGKGINVSKTLAALGKNSLPTGFVGGPTGRFIEEELSHLGIASAFIQVEEATRTNLKIVAKRNATTEINELGPTIKPVHLQALKELLDQVLDASCVLVLSGSLPKGLSKNVYRDLVSLGKAKGASVILDTSGTPFKEGISACPSLIKPNIHELEDLFGMPLSDEKDLFKVCSSLRDKGIEHIVVSLGSEGSYYIGENILKFDALSIVPQSTVGAGDAMVAALALGLHEHMKIKEMMTLAVATSGGAVMTAGTKPMSKEWVLEMQKEVTYQERNEE